MAAEHKSINHFIFCATSVDGVLSATTFNSHDLMRLLVQKSRVIPLFLSAVIVNGMFTATPLYSHAMMPYESSLRLAVLIDSKVGTTAFDNQTKVKVCNYTNQHWKLRRPIWVILQTAFVITAT